MKKYGRDYDKVKHLYDGYVFEDFQVYNPRTVVSLILN